MRQLRVGIPPPQNVKWLRVQNEGVRTEQRQAGKSLALLGATRSAVGEKVAIFSVHCSGVSCKFRRVSPAD